MESELKDQKINVRGVDINYVKTGNGEHPILFTPGTLGSLWLQFKPQMEELDKNKFTVVAWDPPGCGNSRPPDWEFHEDFLERDAAFARDLMEALGHKTFSVVGFCGGGRTSIVLAATYPESIRSIILVSTNSFLLPDEVERYRLGRDVKYWPARQRVEMIELYGDDIVRIWALWVDGLLELQEKRNGNLCTDFLEKIQCPTLIVYGSADGLIGPSHAPFLNSKIRNSRMHIFENGNHFLHLKHSKVFNNLATEFLSSSEPI